MSGSVQPCTGDCNQDGQVAISELVLAVGIALSGDGVDRCDAADTNRDGAIAIAELISAVTAAQLGCAAPADCQPFVVATLVREQSGRISALSGPAVAMRSDGRFAVAWASSGLHLGRGGGVVGDYAGDLFVQRFHADGAVQGEPSHLARNAALSAPLLAFTDSGSLVAVWAEGSGISGGSTGFDRHLAAAFDRNGRLVGTPHVLREGFGGDGDLAGGETAAGVALVLPGLIATPDLPTLTPAGLWRLRNAGAVHGPPVPIEGDFHRVAIAGDGTALVALLAPGAPGSTELRLLRLPPAGPPLPAESIASDADDADSRVELLGSDDHDVAAGDGTAAVVVWGQEETTSVPGAEATSRLETYARLIDPAATAGESVPLGLSPGHPFGVRVAMQSNGAFVVLSADTMRRFDADARPNGAAFAVGNSELTGERLPRDVAVASDGSAVIAWRSDDQIFAQRFPSGLRDRCERPLPPPARTPTPTISWTPSPTGTATASGTPTATATPTVPCGDALLQETESCETCAADCLPRPCTPDAGTTTIRTTVRAPAAVAIADAALLLAYRTTRVSLPGQGSETAVRQRVRPGTPLPRTFSVDDLDHAVRVAIISDAGRSALDATAVFDRCAGSPAVEPSDFACRLEHCRDASGNPLACTCEITLSSTL